MNEIEIGDIFGVSESRISQRLSRIQERLSARVEKEAWSQRERAEEMVRVGEIQGKEMAVGTFEGMAAEKPREMESAYAACFQKGLT